MELRVLHITNAYPYQGNPLYGVFIKEQIDSLKESGGEHRVLFINAKEKGRFQYIKMLIRVKREMRTADIVHCHHFLTAFFVTRIVNRPSLLVSFMSQGISEFTLPVRAFPRYFLKKAFASVVKRSQARIYKHPLGKAEKNDPMSFYLPNGVNTDFFIPRPKEKARERLSLHSLKKIVLFVSLLDRNRPQKRYDRFLEMMECLDKEEYEALVISDIGRDQIVDFYCAADLLVSCSDHEGSPNSVKECLSCGTPVLALETGNMRDLIENVPGCRLHAVWNASSFARDVQDIILEERSQKEIRDVFLNKGFGMEEKRNEMLTIYQKMLKK